MGFSNYWTLSGDWNAEEWELIQAHAAGLLFVGADVVRSREEDSTEGRLQRRSTSDPYEGGKCRSDEVIGFSGIYSVKNTSEDFIIYKREFSFPYEGGAGVVAKEYKQAHGVSFSFCKTNREPMQKYVWAMLVFMHELNPYKIEISNDDPNSRRGMWRYIHEV